MAAIHAAGEPTTVDDLKQPAVPDAANGVLDIRSAYDSIDTTTAAYQRLDEIDLTAPVTPEEQQALREVAAENADALDLVEAAITKGRFDWQFKLRSPLITVALPDLAKLRGVAIIVRASAMASHYEDDDALALRHIRQLLGLIDAADQSPFLVSHLVALGIGSATTDAASHIAPTLNAPMTSPARKHALECAAAFLDEKNLRQTMRSSLLTERVNLFDLAFAISDQKITLAELEQMPRTQHRTEIPAPPIAQRIALEDADQLIPYYKGIIAAATASDWPTLQSKLPTRPVAAPDRYFQSMVMISADRIFQVHYRHIACRRLAAIALATRCYSLDNADKLPTTLNDLVPKYLPGVPTDPFTAGKPMNYHPDQGIIYSVGPDGKDDRGKEPPGRQLSPDIVMHLRP